MTDAPTRDAEPALDGPVAPPRSRSVAADAAIGFGRRLLPVAVSLVVIVALWWSFLLVFGVRRVIGKTPLDVAIYLAGPSRNRSLVVGDLGATLVDAGLGYVSGLLAALLVASAFVLFRSAEQALMPVATLLRSVPLVAMTPLIVLAVGRNLAATGVIGGIVVFFPALVTIVFGLRSASPWAMELVAAYGGGRLVRWRLIMVPSAVPALFAAARLGVPGAMVGALMAEWLATGRGSGATMIKAVGGFRYIEMWSSVVVVTGASVVAYALVGAIESVVLARMGLTGDDTAGR